MSAEPASSRCYLHAAKSADMQCVHCLQYICDACTLQSVEGLSCPPCLQKTNAARRKRSLIIAGVAALAVAGIVFALAVSQPEKKSAQATEPEPVTEPEEPGFDHGEYGFRIENLRATREKNPCAKRVALDLGNKLNAAGDYHGARALVQEFQAECGRYSRLSWIAVYAHEQLGEWTESAKLVTELIDERPYDSDFWWWRGKAHAESGDAIQARADFRQSLAAKPNKFAAARYAKYFGDDEPCEAAFALMFYAEQRPDQEADWATRDAERLYLAGECDRVAGRGSASIEFRDGAPIVKARVKINGQTGTFAVSEQSAYVVVEPELAQRAGIETSPEAPTIYLAEAHQRAGLGTADIAVGKASAKAVPVAVSGSVPGEVDGVLGVSFLSRFAYDRMPGELALTSRTGD